MDYDSAYAAASRLTYDRELAAEIVLLVMQAVVVERVACASIVAKWGSSDTPQAVAERIRARSSIKDE